MSRRPDAPNAGGRSSQLLHIVVVLAMAACGREEVPVFSLAPIAFGERQIRVDWSPGTLAFSPADVRVLLVGADVETLLYEGQIANDGATLGWDNFRPVTDRYPVLILCLNGAEQEDVSLRIHAETGTVARTDRNCRD
ncbi:MAG: hypothetical protein R3315_13600 [Woeseiaceae bacterium]|nr:hypothetical protein [Woeseiaceae bacterium]